MAREHQNRHVRGKTSDILMEIRGAVEVKAGDMMFQNLVAGDLGTGWAPDSRAYPFTWAMSASASYAPQTSVHDGFLGVAMKSSKVGVTEQITIATSGIFRMNRINGTGDVTVGALVSAVSYPHTASAGVSAQSVYTGVSKTMTAPASTAYLGYAVKTESGATMIDFEIRTIFNNLIPQ